MDIKATHDNLLAELLMARTRPGRYGGSLENRARLMLTIVARVRDEVPDILLTSRLWAYDYGVYPYSWGMDRDRPGELDLTETIQLTKMLASQGVRLLNISGGNPYLLPHIDRPFDRPAKGVPIPTEHPLEGVARLFRAAREIQQAIPDLVVMNTGYSWLRQFFPMAAAANIRNGWTRIAGLGRMAFAYPDFARDVLEKGTADIRKVCTTCSKCSELMRVAMAGCVTRDAAIYLPLYQKRCDGR